MNSPPEDVTCPNCGSGDIDWAPFDCPPLHCDECHHHFGEEQ